MLSGLYAVGKQSKAITGLLLVTSEFAKAEYGCEEKLSSLFTMIGISSFTLRELKIKLA
jgi:hypothetical protein